jgi:glycosyltransferase involved in cell wall biosynthesis
MEGTEARGAGSPPSSPKVGIIVATYNSEAHGRVSECLRSVRAQTYPGELEILVVDGGSTDGTLRVAEELADRVVENPHRTELGFAGGKNLGLRESTGELVAMVDADNRLIEPDFLERMARPLSVGSRVVLAVPNPSVPPRGAAPSLCRFFCLREADLWQRWAEGGVQREGWVEFRPPTGIVPNAGLLRRQTLLDLGGWDYDTEVGRRLLADRDALFAWVESAHRLHLEVLGYADLWRKMDRRMRTQMSDAVGKPAVRAEIDSFRRDPIGFLRQELAQPLARAAHHRESAYFHAVPVFFLTSALFVLRGLWRQGKRAG